MSNRPALRWTVFIIGALETIAFVGFVLAVDPFGSSDPLGHGIAVAMSLIMAVPYVVLVVPALILAACGRFLPFAVVLTVLALVAAAFLWSIA